MKFSKSPEALVATFAVVFPEQPGAERRQMFGYPCGFVNGHMCAGLFAEDLFVRLGEDEERELLGLAGAKPFAPMANRPMRGYVCVPPVMHAARRALGRWVGRAVAFAASLPPKVKKAAKARKK
jgi:TfoX/Sxy family transcriptional regulator of competence genes